MKASHLRRIEAAEAVLAERAAARERFRAKVEALVQGSKAGSKPTALELLADRRTQTNALNDAAELLRAKPAATGDDLCRALWVGHFARAGG